jgi:hypothetical protein
VQLGSPFSRCFDHVDDCPTCDYGERKLCPIGRALFDAALKTATMLASPDAPEATAKA